MARSLDIRSRQSEAVWDARKTEIRRIVKFYREASSNTSARAMECLSIALEWANVAKALRDPSEIEALTNILLLIDRFVAQFSSLEQQYLALSKNKIVNEARRVTLDAAALAVAGDRIQLAVRLLEQGRSVVFRQLGQLRTQLDDIQFVAAELGKRFMDLSRQLEELAVASSNHQSRQLGKRQQQFGDDSEYRIAKHYAKISKDWSQVVEDIRGINGFQSFLQPPLFPELQWAADEGPIILVNISTRRSDAIIIVRQVDCPLLVPLPEATPDQVRRLADAFGSGATKLDTPGAIILLQGLWKMIVEPIANALHGQLLHLPFGSHIWWCPTGDAARVPLHAAGPYKPGKRDMLHMYTSSYVPNLTSLIRARKSRPWKPSSSSSSWAGFPTTLLVGQAETPGDVRLPNTNIELQCIKSYAPNSTVLEGPMGVRDAVLSGLKDHAWVHLACHGHRDEVQPFSSHFSLHDGRLSLLDLITTDLPKAELAVLSACHTAGATKELPDEYLHPAAGMMMAGFKSVVATMWALDDNIGPAFAKEFYGDMLGGECGPKGAVHAAAALRKAVMALGRQGVPLMQRINFVHFGI